MTGAGRRRSGAWGSQGGFAPGDAVILLGVLALAGALLWPRLERRAFEERVQETTRAVDAVRVALLEHRRAGGTWPAPAAAGRMPRALVEHLGGGGAAFQAGDFPLEFRRWTLLKPPGQPGEGTTADGAPSAEGSALDGGGGSPGADEAQSPDRGEGDPGEEAEPAPTPPPSPVLLAGLTVHAAEPALLAALLEAYGREDSFVRDTTWTLVLPLGGSVRETGDGPS